MGQLQRIDDAADGGVPIVKLLRLMTILASRSRSGDLAEWIRKERDGYAPDDDVPTYRESLPVRVLGHLSGPLGSDMRNSPLPKTNFPEYYWPWFEFTSRQSVGEMEELLRSGGDDLSIPWPADLVARANRNA